MGRQNIAFLYARVIKAPMITKNNDTGEYNHAMVYLDIVRSLREVGDEKNFVKHDNPLLLTREKEIIEKMASWKENTIVFVKGTLSTKKIAKTSFCPHCTDEGGTPTKNQYEGNLVYVTPIFVDKVKDYDDKLEAIEDIVVHREISNQIHIMGTVLKDPKLVTTKKGIQFTQYPIAINRKFLIRTDDPSIRTDWPIVKSYGEKAREDKAFLRYQAEVIIDGCLQARHVTRKRKCSCCGKLYEFKDHSMELVPYDVEYVKGHKSREEVENETGTSVEEYKQMLYNSKFRDEVDEDLKSDDVDE